MEKTILNRNTLVPVGVILCVLTPIVASIVYIMRIESRVSMNTGRIVAVETIIKDSPTRAEFDTLKDDIKEIKQDIKTLLKSN